MNGLLFLNGKPPKKSVLRAIDKDCFIVCADGAYNYLKDYCVPDVVIGDLDSIIDDKTIKSKEIIRLNKEKDITDGHCALNELIKRGAKSVKIYGALGGRIDHEYCNYSLLKIASDFDVEAAIIGEKFDVYLSKGKFNKNVKKGTIVSLAPFSDSVHILLSTGLKYKITDEVFCKTTSKGISNVAEDICIGFEITYGCALLFICKERIK